MTKKELRKLYREKRNALPAAERGKLDDLLLIQFQQAAIPFIRSLFSYWPMEEQQEPNVHLFTDFMEFRNPELKVAYPRIDQLTGTMEAVTAGTETLFEKNSFGVYEPQGTAITEPGNLDMVFVPLLALDQQGYRVGYGKGFYDRFLADCRTDCLKIGFSYFEPVGQIRDKHEFDVPLNLCITPESVYVF
ncbi:MAG: 5-formyltetrahydrofolate cyclo-ligase [Sphingobacteriales bacterium]|nr:5-formyltetrahydrofolate cyclo-ligase [Sphingobacteriales bacterium]